MSQKILITALAATLILGGCKKKDKPVETQSAPVSTEVSTPSSTPEATAEIPKASRVDYTARGNEPFWSITIKDDQAIYKTPDLPQGGMTVPITKSMAGDALQFKGTLAGQDFMLALTKVECEDDMSGEKFSMTATLLLPNGTFGGCGGKG